MATISTSWSAISPQASRTAVRPAVHQRRGARSSSSTVASTGTVVPVWSGVDSTSAVGSPGCGTRMITAAIAAAPAATAPLRQPAATRAARITISV
jgi:hypothetical protein